MANEKRLVYDSEFKWRIKAIIENRKRMGLPYDQLENVALGLINLCPTVDAVEVVRCKDCRFSAQHDPYDPMECVKWATKWGVVYTTPDGYCHKGERKMVNLEDIVDLDAQTKANNEAMRKVIDFIAGGADNERKSD